MNRRMNLFTRENRKLNRKKLGDSMTYEAEGMLVQMVFSNTQHVCVCMCACVRANTHALRVSKAFATVNSRKDVISTVV